MTQPTVYREIEVAGTPREMGRQIGEAAGEEIRGFCAVALDRLNKNAAISREQAMEIAEGCIPYAEEYAPHMVEELRGVAEAVDLPLHDLMFLQVRNQLQSPSEMPSKGDGAARARREGSPADAGCTSLSLGAPRRDGRLLAQNWDNDPALDEFTVVLTRRPAGKPALMTVTQAGLIAYIGFNEAGVGLCLNTLPAPSRRMGVPHYFTIRGIYEADSLDGAAEAVRRARRAIPANIMLTTPEGPADFEVTLEDAHVLRDGGSGIVTHTNHCLHPDLLAINDRFGELIQSHARKDRIDVLLDGSSGETVSLDDVQAALRDHEDYPRSICRHANDDPETGFWETVFSVIVEPGERRMHVTRGTPCDQPYQTYHLN